MPLTEKGETIKGAMAEEYGPEKGERVFYASKNKGTITGVDAMSGSATPPVSNTPAPVIPQGTTTTPPVTGVNSGITPGATATPQTDGMGVRDLARMAGAGADAWSPQAREAAAEARRAHSGGGGGGGGGLPYNAQTLGRDLTPEEMHANVMHSPMTHPYYQGKTGPEGGQFGSVYSQPRDAKPGSVRDLAVMAGATPLPEAPKPVRPAGASDAKPGSVRALARAAGALP